MIDFKPGDKVKRKTEWMENRYPEGVLTVKHIFRDYMAFEETEHYGYVPRFELVSAAEPKDFGHLLVRHSVDNPKPRAFLRVFNDTLPVVQVWSDGDKLYSWLELIESD